MKKLWMALIVGICLVAGAAIVNAQDNAPAAGVNGKWHFVLDTPGGDRDIDADFTVDADGKVTGMFGRTSTAGTYKDGKLSLDFQFTSDESGETGAFKILGTLDQGGALTGNWQFTAYDGTFKATRPKS